MCGLAQVIPDVMDQTSTCWLGTEVWRRRSCPRHMTVALNCEVRPKIAIELLQKGNVNINVSVRPIWPISRNSRRTTPKFGRSIVHKERNNFPPVKFTQTPETA
ncbi:hypothetical protein AVEN_150580-1 [Araneus ventricosus]|uniref:Uncharacterized protein n=1 Tax=Araneus ventricosus TaxID=182803 RepID=A0A4Y2SND0_ARAVE|nr:hypothetical protein AVEN_150580-1 [Araneus ventricosus]